MRSLSHAYGKTSGVCLYFAVRTLLRMILATLYICLDGQIHSRSSRAVSSENYETCAFINHIYNLAFTVQVTGPPYIILTALSNLLYI